MSKPVVMFDRFIGLGEHPHTGETNATLGGIVGHPVLGAERVVFTSRLVRVMYDDACRVTEVETKNTIYRLRDPDVYGDGGVA